jgi:hypothetical protein
MYEIQRAADLKAPAQWEMWTNVLGPEWLSPLIDSRLVGQSQALFRTVTR